ncbi:uncharacterized protein N7459_006331 [Penicillium hispanicum]|uniref:uncharacterized protein n=1 Tax=Penicillium hispanicum TaxID=1080232 RepID=UPI0025408D9C|nr:uncharacterized protein N7459_006331 [Penicillium hispanicum]KAJ5580346.1 hypothetical protein N7459_006331 [Penicillium hispanicum]
MAIFRLRRSQTTISRFITLLATLACISFVWIAIPSNIPLKGGDIPSFTEEKGLDRRAEQASLQTVAQLAVSFDTGGIRPPVTSTNPLTFQYQDSGGKKRKSTVTKKVGPNDEVARRAMFFGLGIGEVKQKRTFSSKSQGWVYLASLSALSKYTNIQVLSDHLYDLFDGSPAANFIYNSFLTQGTSSTSWLLIPRPQTTLYKIFQNGQSGLTKEEIMARLPELFLGIRHIFQKGLWSPLISPGNVFMSTKPRANAQEGESATQIATFQWAIAAALDSADANSETNFWPDTSVDKDIWRSPATVSLTSDGIRVEEQQSYLKNKNGAATNYNLQKSTVYRIAFTTLGVLAMYQNKLDLNVFPLLADKLQKPDGDGTPSSTQEILSRYFVDGSFPNVKMSEEIGASSGFGLPDRYVAADC